MEYSRLEQNIIDVIEEEQIKLGYRSENVRLYYPLASLNHFLKQEYSVAEMYRELGKFCDAVRTRLGDLMVSHEKERFCIQVPVEGVDYVHAHLKNTDFIYELIKTVGKHDCGMEEVFQVFQQYSDHVHIEQIEQGEFDYLVYFEDGLPDGYRYCFTEEGCHVIYHRFTVEDYQDFAHADCDDMPS